MHNSFVNGQYKLQDKEDKRLKKCFTLGSRLLGLKLKVSACIF